MIKSQMRPRPEWNPVPFALQNKVNNQKLLTYRLDKRSALMSRKLRVIRRRNIATCKVLGMSNKQIGELFNIGANTVGAEIKMAEKTGILDELNSRILSELVPEAIRVYKDKMTKEDDAFVAKDVLKHLDRLTQIQIDKQSGDQPKYSIDAYIKAKAPKELGDGEINIKQVIEGERARQILEASQLTVEEHSDVLQGVRIKEGS